MAPKLPHQTVPAPQDATDASTKDYTDGVAGGGSLDIAYDFGGAGLGRFITADNGPVQITAASNTGLSVISGSTTIELGKPIVTPLSLAGIYVDSVPSARARGLQWHTPTLAANAGVAVEANLEADEQALIAIEGATSTFTSRGMTELYNNITGATRPMMFVSKAPTASTGGNLLYLDAGTNATDPAVYLKFNSNVGLQLYNASPSNTHGDLRFDDGRTADPSAPLEGEMWYRSDTEKLRLRLGSSTVDIPASGGGGGTLQSAYEGGNTIDTSTNGTVALSNTADGFTNIMSITRQPVSAFQGGNCLSITNGPNTNSSGIFIDERAGSGAGIWIDTSNASGTAHGLHIDAANVTNRSGLAVTDSGQNPSSTDASLIYTSTSNNGNTRPNIWVRRSFFSGTGGDGIVIDFTSNNIQGRGVRFDSAPTQAADIQFSSRTADPTVLGEGDFWYNSTAKIFKYHDGTSIQTFGGGGGGGSLDDAYTTGQSIDVDIGAVTLTNNNADNNNVLEITKSPVGIQSGSGLTITLGAQTSSDALVVTQGGTGQAATFNGPVTVNDKLTVTGLIDPTGLVLDAQASKPTAGAAGKLVIWAQSGATTKIKFTDSADADKELVVVGDTSTPAPTTVALDETGGPTTLTIGDIADGELLVRSGSTITSQAPGAPGSHASTHQDGGGDEISVAGLSGVLADGQKAAELGTTGASVNVDSAAPPSNGQVLTATGATTATWQDPSGGGGSHASTHEDGGADEISVAGLSGVLVDAQKADTIITTDPATLTVATIADGEVLVRSGTTITSQAAGAPSAHASSHADGGADELTVQDLGSGVAASGKVLETDGSGGWSLIDTPSGSSSAVAAAGGDYLYATLSANYTATLVVDDPVPFDTTDTSRGELSIDANGRVSGLKAGRTYYVNSGARASDGRVSVGLYDVTASSYLGTDALSTDLTPSQASLAYPYTPTEDSQVEIRITGFNSSGNDINQSGSFLQIIEIGAVQADVVGGLEYLDSYRVTGSPVSSVTFGASGDGVTKRALDGDVDSIYLLHHRTRATSGISAAVVLRPNGVSSDQVSRRITHQSSTITYAGLLLNQVPASGLEGGELTFYARTGVERTYRGHSYLQTADPPTESGQHVRSYTGTWDETVTNITSLVIATDDAGVDIDVGSEYILYRVTQQNLRADSADSYERRIEGAVAIGTATTEQTTGHSVYGGSVVGLSVRVEEAVTAGTVTVNLKVDGSTTLSAVLDTSNPTSRRVVAAQGEHTFAADKNISVEVVASGYSNAAVQASGITAVAHLTNDSLLTQNNRVVAKTVLTSDTDTLTLSGLDGDNDGEYEVTGQLFLTTSAVTLSFRPNGSGTSMTTASVVSGGTETVGTTGEVLVGGATSSYRQLKFRMRLFASRTVNGASSWRGFEMSAVEQIGDGDGINVHSVRGSFVDATANLASFDFSSSVASGLLDGSEVVVRRIEA